MANVTDQKPLPSGKPSVALVSSNVYKSTNAITPSGHESTEDIKQLFQVGAKHHFVSTHHPRRSFEYKRLDRPNNIRLVELEPSSSAGDPIKCTLTQHSLSTCPQYDVLSYSREPSPESVAIGVNGEAFDVSPHLWSALRRLRSMDRPRLFWIDAVSINHGDAAERNQETGRLMDIYENANQVVLWIGEEADDSALVYRHIREWREKRDLHRAGKRIGPNFDPINLPLCSGNTREAYLQLCKRPVFRCTRIIPEITYNKKVRVACGEDTEDFSLLVRCCTTRMDYSTYHPFTGLHGPSHVSYFWQISAGSRTPHNVLLASSRCRASDPRDEIFAFFGLFHRTVRLDYDSDVAEVYQKLARLVIEETGELDILQSYGTKRHQKGLCSWVPDFSVSEPVGVLRPAYPVLTREDHPRLLLPGFQFEGTTFTVLGKYVESIHSTGGELVADAAHAPHTQGFNETIHRWECLAAQLVKRFPRPISDAFADTIIADVRSAKGRVDVSDHWGNGSIFVAWYNSRYGGKVLRNLDSSYFSSFELAQKSKEVTHWESRTEIYAQQMEIMCYGRSFFTTDKGSMGLAPPQARKEDMIVYLPGGRNPFVLRPRGDQFEMIGDCFLYDLDVYNFIMEDKTKMVRSFQIV